MEGIEVKFTLTKVSGIHPRTGQPADFWIEENILDEDNCSPGTFRWLNHEISFEEAQRLDKQYKEDTIRMTRWSNTPQVSYIGRESLPSSIKYCCTFGEHHFNVDIAICSGAGNSYNVSVEGFYHGRVSPENEGWRNTDYAFDTGDFEAIVELIESYRRS